MDDTAASPDVDPTATPPAGEPAAPVPAPPAPAAPSAPWEGPSPDVVAWLLVNWHNKHPLARRLGIADIHTVGAVALPFMAQALPKEPSLEGGAPVEAPPAAPRRRWPWQRRPAASGPRPAWIEEFIPGLKTSAVASMALDNGFTSAPDELPLRRVDIDERALAGDANQAGAWPMELVLLSAAFDAGPARRRVLVGRRDQVLGQRALDPARLGAAGCVAALLLVVAFWALWPSSKPSKETLAAQAAAEAASAASAAAAASAAQAASAARAASAAEATRAAEAASTASAAMAATAASEVASATAETQPASAATAGASAPGTGGIPSIRPSLQSGVERARQEQADKAAGPAAGKSGDKPEEKVGDKAGDKSAADKPGTDSRVGVDDTGLASLMKRDAAPGAKVVALVGAPYKTKAEAEAVLARMREMVGQTTGGTPPSGEVFQTKEGWRAAVWPFSSREEAQLINATLLARGIRGTRAVDF